MEISAMLFWNIILTIVIAPAFWAFKQMFSEVKRIQILLNKTREEYATRMELRDDMQQVMAALHRVEDKLDNLLSKK
jgi:membrane protein insertase Oxa1/YidC/SpoIIIJ|tara:strand:+ start:971 stop:1201 length:231 start_codon:yes stop_codon:yes gene_type:complete